MSKFKHRQRVKCIKSGSIYWPDVGKTYTVAPRHDYDRDNYVAVYVPITSRPTRVGAYPDEWFILAENTRPRPKIPQMVMKNGSLLTQP